MSFLTSSNVWTGDLNRTVLPNLSQLKVGLYDTTLRDGEQSVGIVFEPEEKLEIARLLDEMGVERIEAGFARVSDEDRSAIQMILKEPLKAQVWGFSRALVEDVAAVAELGCRWAIIEAPVSDIKLRALGVSRDKVAQRIAESIAFAVRQGIAITFFGVDGSRAELAFLEHIYKLAVDSGASEVAVVDTLGIATPEAVAFLVESARHWVGPSIPIHFHGHNDFGLATACAVTAARSGADWIHCTLDGMGERAGNANLAQVALALGALYNVRTNLRLDKVRAASERLRQIARYELEPWKPLVGQNLFVRETGAVAAQFHIPEAIEPYSAQLVNTARGIVMGKKSGLASIRLKCEELGLDIAEERYPALLAATKDLAAHQRALVSDQDFRKLAARMSISVRDGL
jgi:isopropylmalate/homocitrate/citramalate synthase